MYRFVGDPLAKNPLLISRKKKIKVKKKKRTIFFFNTNRNRKEKKINKTNELIQYIYIFLAFLFSSFLFTPNRSYNNRYTVSYTAIYRESSNTYIPTRQQTYLDF